MIHEFSASLSLPVAPGCPDTVSVRVMARADVHGDDRVCFLQDAVVIEEVGTDDRTRLYASGQRISSEVYNATNIDQLETAYHISREVDAFL